VRPSIGILSQRTSTTDSTAIAAACRAAITSATSLVASGDDHRLAAREVAAVAAPNSKLSSRQAAPARPIAR